MIPPKTIDQQVGQQIRECRLDCGYTQTQLAEALNVTFQQIQKYERGANRISASSLCQTAEFLRVPIAYFFSRADDIPAINDIPARQRRELLRHFSNVACPTARKDLIRMTRSLARLPAPDPESS